MICPNCKQYFSNKFNLCPYCGAENLELKICYNCEFESYKKELMFCPKCGKRLFNKKEYNKIKIKEENERKKEFQKIIDNADLDSTSKLTLNDKINLYLITNLKELDKEISIEKRKKVLKTIVDNTNLESTTKSGLKYEINVGIIRNKDDLVKAFDIKKIKVN